MKNWDPDEALDFLKMEREVMSDGTIEDTARRLFRENLVPATQAICHLAIYGLNEKLRLEAAKYVVERVMGRDEMVTGDPLEKLIGDIVRYEEAQK